MSLFFEQTTTDSKVAVTLSNNSFDDSTYFVRVPRDKVTLDNIVSEISAGYPSIDPFVIIHAAQLIREQILKFITQGKAVDVLELGTMYLSPEGTVTRSNPQVSDLPEIGIKFTPSSSVKEAISGISANSFMISDSAPEISVITSLKDGNTDGTLYQGYLVQLTGGKLKVDVDNENSGIFFVPVLDSGEPNPDEDTWKAVDTSYMPKNTKGTLQFYPPATVTLNIDYYIAVRTSYLSGGRTRKTPVTGYSSSMVAVVSGDSQSQSSYAAAPSSDGNSYTQDDDDSLT